jgi:signal transduction histidine kinase
MNERLDRAETGEGRANGLTVTVSDQGFDVAVLAGERSNFGLSSVRERLQLLGGEPTLILSLAWVRV